MIHATYNIFYHPLRHFPGPRLWTTTKLLYTYFLWTGQLHTQIKIIHDEYGAVVRITPDELSFIESSAWKSIYTGQVGNKGFPKHGDYKNAQGFESLYDASDENHTRLRKLLVNNFFSAAAVNKQEAIIHTYADTLTHELRNRVREGAKDKNSRPPAKSRSAVVNIQEWYNFATFDIAGKLTVSEDFGCLNGLTYQPWVLMVLTHFKLSVLVMCLRIYSPLDKVLMRLAPRRLLRLREKFLRLSKEKISRRLAKELPPERDDFVSEALKKPKHGGMNLAELEANCLLMILAASETMATSLLSATNLLSKNTRVLETLVNEIRKHTKEEELVDSRLKQLPFLNAVIRETHRLCPPLANGPARVVGPETWNIAGHLVPPE
jgi:cytochrome P450